MKIISEIRGPKQRITRVFGYILVQNSQKHERQGDKIYSVHRKYYDDGSLDGGHYDLTLDEAWAVYKEKVYSLLEYGVSTFDMDALK